MDKKESKAPLKKRRRQSRGPGDDEFGEAFTALESIPSKSLEDMLARLVRTRNDTGITVEQNCMLRAIIAVLRAREIDARGASKRIA